MKKVSGIIFLPAFGAAGQRGPAPRANNPRSSFSLDQTGNYLFVANQGADYVGVYRVDPTTGKLTAAGRSWSPRRPSRCCS